MNKIFIGVLLLSCICKANTVRHVRTDKPIISLTFDDGPEPPYTGQVLAVLKQYHVQATFFLIGTQVEQNRDQALRIISEGHEIGGHSYNWSSWIFKSNRSIEQLMDQMQQAFSLAGIPQPSLFRTPNGILMPWQQSILKRRGLKHITADVIAGDWKDRTADQIADYVLKKTTPGSIIVLHDGGGDRTATVTALATIIQTLKKRGYEFLPVSQLLKYQ
ncbi:MAG: polysaccharide deacetylase family protein [Kiritimatiellales bacterium]